MLGKFVIKKCIFAPKPPPISKKLAGGCCLNKNIYNLIQNNGFKFENINKMFIPSTLSLYAYQYWGIAKKNT